MKDTFLTKEPKNLANHYLTDNQAAGHCQYGMLKDELVRDRLVSGIQNDSIREKLLSKKDFILTKAIQLLKSSEATHMQAQDVAAPSEMGTI